MAGRRPEKYPERDFEDRENLVEKDQTPGFGSKAVDVLSSRPARFTYLALVCIGLGILVPMWFLHFYPLDVDVPIYTRGSCMIAPQYRFPCLVGRVGEGNVTDRMCAEAGCCWYDVQKDDPHEPAKCFHSLPASYTYKLAAGQQNKDSLNATLRAYSYADARAGRPARTPYGTNETQEVTARVSSPEPHRALLEIGAGLTASQPRPVTLNGTLSISSNFGDDWDFYAVVTRNSTGQVLVDTRLGATIVSELYTELTIVPASTAVYGLGQSFHPTLRRSFEGEPRAALFSRPVRFAEGAHPFYMCIEPSGLVHGVYLETAAPVEVELLAGPSITLRVMTGSVRLHVLAGPTPADVSDQYTQLVGRPRLPPLWSLGFHMCRQGDPDAFDEVADEMANHGVPFESDCVDADALVPLGFDTASDALRAGGGRLHKEGRHLMAYMTPQLPLYREPLEDDQTTDYQPYVAAEKAGILVRDADGAGNFFGEFHDPVGNLTWNVSYVDFSNGNTVGWMKPLYKKLVDDFGVDGLYLMRDAPDNDGPDRCQDQLPFVPNMGEPSSLSNHTVCMMARHADGSHLQLHNAYGRNQTTAVRQAMPASGPQPLLTSASTAPGSGSVGGHLQASLTADWESLQQALVQTMELGLYGVPQAGYPLCGSRNSSVMAGDDADGRITALCLLWYQLAPYLPLAVSYYEADHFPRNPPQLGDAFLNQALVHISQRYVFVPYHYTLLVEAAASGAPPLRPLWYEFADDNVTWSLDQQLLLGPALMVAPALKEAQRTVRLYLPGQCWYEYFQGYRPKETAGPAWVTLPVPPQQTLIYQRGASVIFNQQPRQTLEEQRKEGNYSLTVAMSCEGDYSASGHLHLPGDGDAILPQIVKVQVISNSTLEITADLDKKFCDFYQSNGYVSTLEHIKIFGIMEEVERNITAVLTDANGISTTILLEKNQNLKPPSLIINGFEQDWCLYPKANITWYFLEE